MMTRFDKTLDHLPLAIVKQFEDFLEQFSLVPEAESLLNEPLFIQSAASVIGVSEYIAQTGLRHPELLIDLFVNGDIARAQSERYYQHQYGKLCGASRDQQELSKNLRILRQREMMRIAWRDMAGWAKLSETCYELSTCADVIITNTIQQFCHWRSQVYGNPRNKHGDLSEIIVVALGKLGGKELNFSSDIDLLFAYVGSGQTDGKPSQSNEKFFRQVAQDFINILSQVTEYGFVYRVDMRLRPYGDSGPLVMALRALDEYYQTQGRDWERYALVKARVVHGSENARKKISNIIKPFVYRRYVDYSVIASLRELKLVLDRETKRLQLYDNIKRGPGGIREIEFIVQAFQVIRGGKESFLQATNLLAALNYISLLEGLPQSLVKELVAAYKFLRILENRLQMLNDRQTQRLPKLEALRTRLYTIMGYAGWGELIEQLETHRKNVKDHFNKTITSREAKIKESPSLLKIKELLQNVLDDKDNLKTIKSLSETENAEVLLAAIQQIKNSQKLKMASKRAQNRLNDFLPQLIEKVLQKKSSATVLQRTLPIIEAICKRSAYVALLLENEIALNNLVGFCSTSEWIAKKLAQYPLLLDELLVKYNNKPIIKHIDLQEELKQMLLSVPQEDLESQMEFMRQFKHTHEVRAAIYDALELLAIEEISDYLSLVAEVIIEQAYQIVQAHLSHKHGLPTTAEGHIIAPEFLIIAYGKLGGKELTYESDLDLVFLHGGETQLLTNGSHPITLGEFYVRLGQRLINMLSVRTTGGSLYQIDVRLRPSGTAGMLVSQFDAYKRYQLEKAWTWEHQALVRARAILGPKHLFNQFEETRAEVLAQVRDEAQLKQTIEDMRIKMLTHKASQQGRDIKRDKGGITDIEFMVQYHVLAQAHQHPELIPNRSNLALIRQLMVMQLLTESDGECLISAFRQYRQALHYETLGMEGNFGRGIWLQYSPKLLKIWENLMIGSKKDQ